MASSTSSSPRRLFLTLAGMAVVTLAGVGLLLFRTRSTVVEIEAVASRFELTAVPPPVSRQDGDGPAALQKVDLLAPSLRTKRLDFLGADRIEAYFEHDGQTTLRPGAEGRVRVTSPDGDGSFQPELRGFGALRFAVETAGRDRGGGLGLRITVPPLPSPAGEWTGGVAPADRLDVELRGADSPDPVLHVVPATAPDLVAAGGRQEATLGLSLPPGAPPSTRLRLIDPTTGSVNEKSLPFLASAPHVLAWGNKLALLEPDPGGGGPATVLRPDLKIVSPAFFRTSRLEDESFLLGGKIRFPAGEKEPLDLEPRFLLSLAADEPLTLRSLSLDDGRLTLVLWGRATSLRLGPTAELQAEVLPSLFVWLYTHQLRTLVYSTLASVLGLCLGAIKMLGLFKE